jgi:hypothetical protein
MGEISIHLRQPCKLGSNDDTMKKTLGSLLDKIDSFVVFTGELFDNILSFTLDMIATIFDLAILLMVLVCILFESYTQSED